MALGAKQLVAAPFFPQTRAFLVLTLGSRTIAVIPQSIAASPPLLRSTASASIAAASASILSSSASIAAASSSSSLADPPPPHPTSTSRPSSAVCVVVCPLRTRRRWPPRLPPPHPTSTSRPSSSASVPDSAVILRRRRILLVCRCRSSKASILLLIRRRRRSYVRRRPQDAYTEAAKEIHGPGFDIMNSPLDTTVVYKARKGKKHGRFLMGAGYISTPTTLSEVRTTSTGSTDDVQPPRRLRPLTDIVTQLKTRLQDEIEARQRLEQMILALLPRLDGTTPVALLPTLSTPATVGSMVDSNAPEVDAGDGTHVSSPNHDHVDESIIERPLEDNANECTHK